MIMTISMTTAMFLVSMMVNDQKENSLQAIDDDVHRRQVLTSEQMHVQGARSLSLLPLQIPDQKSSLLM